jgi:hypothetical protein
MKQVPDGKRLRRKNSPKQGFTYLKIGVNALIGLPFLAATVLSIVSRIAWLLSGAHGKHHSFYYYVLEIVLDAICIAVTMKCARNIRRHMRPVAHDQENHPGAATQIGLVQYRKNSRRRYLRRKGSGYIKMVAWTAVLLPSLLLAGSCLVGSCLLLLTSYPDRRSILVAFVIGMVSAIPAWWSCRTIIRIERELDQLPVIPSVTPDTLPAEEILVRGSEESPVAQSEVLLRAV